MSRVTVGGASTGTARARTEADEAEAATPAKKVKATPAPAGTVRFHTLLRESVPFDLYVDGTCIVGAWNTGKTAVEWAVPADLADNIDRHHYVVTGRIGRAE
ncbi:hypothetical protein TSH7_09935 [Azospirillum sp. TSH7]|uniref:hypothetical protein n=1 Tax=unclassified Azospirillum TaxID=2630922 RepID=UPI000D6157D6|nr:MULTISPECIES: hypothetical protein [unclassified Azospirillum]PWC63988.1 hypothetical protein TSH20_19030 [Azospirillum sp. TSH20]PWC64851.1 hypothetical protein TSH7_09935 [Azospirillum sp. TSH7]